MKTAAVKIRLVLCLMFLLCGCVHEVRAQAAEGAQTTTAAGTTTAADEVRPSEPRVPLAQQAVAFDIDGRTALGGMLRTAQLAGTPEAPERNSRIVIQNRSALFYNYISGWATFYGADGVRCGEGQWKLEALAPNESAEVDTPGLRLTCTPSTWRIVAISLLTRTGDVAKPGESTPASGADASIQPQGAATTTPTTSNTAPSTIRTLPPLEINVNGKTIPIQPGNPLELTVGKERVRITVQPVP